MGNKCPACLCGADGSSDTVGSKKRKKSESVLPADLHSSGALKNPKGSSLNHSQRPDNLSLQSPLPTSKEKKFPDFSLHGVQKSSPPSPTCTPIQCKEPPMFDPKRVEHFFLTYKDEDEDSILADGIERFCSDLGVDPAEFIVLVLAWKLKAGTMCKFTREEFINGCVDLKCDSISSIQASFEQIRNDAHTDFRDLYRFTFQFALDADEGQRSLPCDIAIAMWNVVFSTNQPRILDSWIRFLQENNVRGISRDTWNMLPYLVDAISDNINNYNDTEAWPSLFDDFVIYQKEELNKAAEEATVVSAVTDDNDNTTKIPNDVTISDDVTTRIPCSISTSGESTPNGNSPGSPIDAPLVEEPPSNLTPQEDSCGNSPGEILSHLHS